METKHFTANEVPTQFSHKHGSSNTFWIVFISVLFFLFLLFSKWNKIEEFFGFSTENVAVNTGFAIGEEVSVEGILTQDGDFITHTHKLTTLTSGVFGLKSKTINLNQYSGTVLVEGIVDSDHEGLYIIDVTQVIAQFDENALSGTIQTGEAVPTGEYHAKAGIYLSPSFFDEYTVVSDTNNTLQVKSLTSNTIVKIDYFTCKKGDSNRDCKQLSSTFADSNEKTFTTQYGTLFYKLAEVNSWFFANQDLFGYFINNAPEQEVTKLSSYLVLPTSDYVKEMIEPKVSSLCLEGNIIMTQIKKTTLFLDQGTPAVKFAGTWEKGTAECTLSLDLSLPTLATVKTFTYKEDGLTGSVQTPATQTPSLSNQSASTAQFPVALDKALVFTSSRGHSISFPSPKVSYKSNSISDNLGTAGVNCYVATNIIEYAKKDLIDSEPKVVVYECKIKGNVDLSSQYYVRPLSDGRTFLISVLDPAWDNFAQNIQITLN